MQDPNPIFSEKSDLDLHPKKKRFGSETGLTAGFGSHSENLQFEAFLQH
jgi:hypothetical protein